MPDPLVLIINHQEALATPVRMYAIHGFSIVANTGSNTLNTNIQRTINTAFKTETPVDEFTVRGIINNKGKYNDITEPRTSRKRHCKTGIRESDQTNIPFGLSTI
ncbi:unnamed protein product [Phytophthora fragariaefolia]|uniref:Unnamed protein product n=1 Tax=Phytophthora fragariaefolia TaxID=1490495 RepID=A0A9W6XKZ6_9STRA|nr:unnamed protein product [Phytophthora fragariaefolia]